METRNPDHPSSCTFCELIHGSAEVSICHEDADAIAFMDIQPVNNGHVLVVPREHHESLLDVPEELGAHLFRVTMRLANAIRHVTGCEDMNIVVNSGAAAGQDEPHYHVHIIPRRPGDGFDIPLPFNGSQMPDRTVLDAYAVQIISALRDPVRGSGHGEHGEHAAQAHGATTAAASSGAGLSASGTATPVRKTTAFRADRAVPVELFSEAPTELADVARRATAVRRRQLWSAEEGAHGELRSEMRYDAGTERGDAV
jgi:histidine triad (HIT) family protein